MDLPNRNFFRFNFKIKLICAWLGCLYSPQQKISGVYRVMGKFFGVHVIFATATAAGDVGNLNSEPSTLLFPVSL